MLIRIISLMAILLLTGCWNKEELPKNSYIMGSAVDIGEDGKLKLSIEVYRPKQSKGGGQGSGGGSASYIDLSVSAQTIMEAIRELPSFLGRKANWSHMRVIVISDELAKSRNVGEVLDFFYRDHEPRLTTSVIIAKGVAKKFLNGTPLIETTMGQQMLRGEVSSYENSAQTTDSKLLSLGVQLESELGNAIVAYVQDVKGSSQAKWTIKGISLLKKGKLVDTLAEADAENLLMLRNEYKSGVTEIPCSPNNKSKVQGFESMEILSLQTKLQPKIEGNDVKVHVSTKLAGAIGELKCTMIKTKEDEEKYITLIEDTIKKNMSATIAHLQNKKIDVLNIGNMIYAQNPTTWFAWKKTWDDRFAKISFDIEVKGTLITTGTTTSEPVFPSPSSGAP